MTLKSGGNFNLRTDFEVFLPASRYGGYAAYSTVGGGLSPVIE